LDTNKQTTKQTDKQSMYKEGLATGTCINFEFSPDKECFFKQFKKTAPKNE